MEERKKCVEMYLVIEDVRPYRMQITNGIIETIKFLGVLQYRLEGAGIEFKLIPRYKVKEWVFKNYTAMSRDEISKSIVRIEAREKLAQGDAYIQKPRSVTFVYVDDRIVQKAMRLHWNIPARTGFGQKSLYNLKDHAWAALGVLTCFMTENNISVGMSSVPLIQATP
jgi:hypothetical protein